MPEFAFTVNHDSKLYSNYFTEKNEKEKFMKLAESFFDAHFGDGPRKYRMEKSLMCSLSDEEEQQYANQLKVNSLGREIKEFLARSPMNKSWQEEVYSKISPDNLTANRFWAFMLSSAMMSSGRFTFNMWDNGAGEVYGYISFKYMPEDAKLPDQLTQIKMSQYYAEIEKIEEKQKAGDADV